MAVSVICALLWAPYSFWTIDSRPKMTDLVVLLIKFYMIMTFGCYLVIIKIVEVDDFLCVFCSVGTIMLQCLFIEYISFRGLTIFFHQFSGLFIDQKFTNRKVQQRNWTLSLNVFGNLWKKMCFQSIFFVIKAQFLVRNLSEISANFWS